MGDERCGSSKEVNTPESIGQRVRVMLTLLSFFREFRKRPALFRSGQWHFHQNNAPVHNSILVTDYSTKMGISTVPKPPYSPDLAPCVIWLFSEAVVMRQLRTWKRLWWRSLTHSHKRTSIGLPDVVWTVQLVNCSRSRLLRWGLEFHVCTMNKSAHTKKKQKGWNLI